MQKNACQCQGLVWICGSMVVACAIFMLFIAGVDGRCEAFCGNWTCPYDYCHECEATKCGHTSRSSEAISGQQFGGTPDGYTRATFVDKKVREAPALDLLGAEYPSFAAHQHVSNVATITMGTRSHTFSAFHLGTNWPMYSPKESVDDAAPVLAAAGVRFWRWPGGAVSNFWCPTL